MARYVDTTDGWTLWQDVSEPSPISPTFDTSTELRDWIWDNEFGLEPLEHQVQIVRDALLEWIESPNASAVSMVMVGGRTFTGLQWAAIGRAQTRLLELENADDR